MVDQPRDRFETTHWSLVVAAGQQVSPESDRALTELCRKYWYPLYAFVRRRVADVHEAQDLTQEFFTRLLEKNFFAAAHPERGRFRAFLRASLQHFLANEWEKARALKRGGGRPVLSLDFPAGETRLALEPVHADTPERLFDRQWALTLLDHVLTLLRAEYEAAGKAVHFEQLKGSLTGEQAPDGGARAAEVLGMSEGAVRVAVHRLRKRFRHLLRAEISQTVADPAEVEDEVRRLFEVLGS